MCCELFQLQNRKCILKPLDPPCCKSPTQQSFIFYFFFLSTCGMWTSILLVVVFLFLFGYMFVHRCPAFFHAFSCPNLFSFSSSVIYFGTFRRSSISHFIYVFIPKLSSFCCVRSITRSSEMTFCTYTDIYLLIYIGSHIQPTICCQ